MKNIYITDIKCNKLLNSIQNDNTVTTVISNKYIINNSGYFDNYIVGYSSINYPNYPIKYLRCINSDYYGFKIIKRKFK